MVTHKNLNKHQKVDADKPRDLVGRKVYYIGNGIAAICETCGIKRFRGMVSEVQGKLYCSEACAIRATK